MAPQERNIKLSIDDAELRKLAQKIDEAADKILKNGMITHSPQKQAPNDGDIFDTAYAHFSKPLTGKNSENTDEDITGELSKKMFENFQGMLAATEKMLQNAGLINTEFGKIVQMIISFVNMFGKVFEFGKSVFSVITSLFLPGGGEILGLLPGSTPGAGSLAGTGNLAPDMILPASNNSFKTVYIVPRDTVIRGRDIHTVWAVEDAISEASSI